MAILFDAIVQDGTYTTDDNLTKPYWRKVGIICDTRNGGMAMKIEVDLNTIDNFNGWIQFAKRKDDES